MTTAEKLQTAADNIPKVYEAGKKAEYDKLWVTGMKNLQSRPYENKYAFAGPFWTDTTFNPNMSLTPNVAEGFFFQSYIVDLNGILERNGVTFDFSHVTHGERLAYYSNIRNFPVTDLSSANNNSGLRAAFAGLTNGDVSLPLILSNSGQQTFTNTFDYSEGLTDLVILGGVIGKSINLTWSTRLTRESMISVINALSDTSEGTTVTLSKTAVDNAFETASGTSDGSTSEEWLNLIAAKSNWTFSLV